MGDVVSHLSPVRAELTKQAFKIGAKAEARLAMHRDKGESYIHVRPSGAGTKLDAYVELVDPNGGAAAIEFGWRQARKFKDEGVVEYGADGLKILGGAI